MKDIVVWCVQRSPRDIGYADTFSALDMHAHNYLKKVLLKHLDYTEEELTELTFADIAGVIPNAQYAVLLAHILATGIDNLGELQISKYLGWMFDNDELYDCGLIAWIYYNSVLNNPMKYPAHSVICNMLPEGCRRNTLETLWRIACVGEPVVINTLRTVHQFTGTKWYLPLIAYFYLCSGANDECLNYFFSDVHKIQETDVDYCYYLCTLYLWDGATFNELIRRNYTIRSVFRVLKQLGPDGIKEPEMTLDIRNFPKRISTSVKFSEFKYIKNLPVLPAMYVPNQNIWNPDIPAYSNISGIHNPCEYYASWFAELSDEQVARLAKMDSNLFTACKTGKFNEVALVLNNIMYSYS